MTVQAKLKCKDKVQDSLQNLLDDWLLASLYCGQTKEQLNVESVSNVSQYLVTYRRTNSRVRQAQVIEQASESANTDQIWNGQNVIWFP